MSGLHLRRLSIERELFRPGFRLREADGGPVAMQTAPLRPILGPGDYQETGDTKGQAAMHASGYSDLNAASSGERRAARVAASDAPIPVASTAVSSKLSDATGS